MSCKCEVCGNVKNHPRTSNWIKVKPVEKACVYCGGLFISKRSDQTSCGKRDALHRPTEKLKTSIVVCANCEKSFEKRNSDINRTERNGGKHYCGQKCMGNAYKNRVILICSQCGKEFERAVSNIKSDTYNFCSKACQSKNTDYVAKGENHHRYINGDTCYKRGENWVAMRREVRKRDNYTCQSCGKTEKEIGKRLDVHHIKPYRLFDNCDQANTITNLISLCSHCHHVLDANLIKLEKQQIKQSITS